ncbi:hypothetical protein DFS34DRAFT_594300 [Phlyctochytrium arcticum]|nr:hypothetical protein DFS34DRAFT_594300 [Phlyctochytrium arcticum]
MSVLHTPTRDVTLDHGKSVLPSLSTGTHPDASAEYENPEDSHRKHITKVLDLQEALMATLARVESAQQQHMRIAAENATLLEYVNNLMEATGQQMSAPETPSSQAQPAPTKKYLAE